MADQFECIAVLYNGSCAVHRTPTEKSAWALARRWIRYGIDESDKGWLLSPSAIREVQVRLYDSKNWEPQPAPDEPVIAAPPDRKIIVPSSVGAEAGLGVAID